MFAGSPPGQLSVFPLSQAELTCRAGSVSEFHAQGLVGTELGVETGLQQGHACPKPGQWTAGQCCREDGRAELHPWESPFLTCLRCAQGLRSPAAGVKAWAGCGRRDAQLGSGQFHP